jgi:hypothetical protein
MWKAVLVLFMTSSTQPMSMMMGHFPKVFVSKDACQEFISGTRGDIDGTVDVFTKFASLNFEVLHHELSCVEDESGEPA